MDLRWVGAAKDAREGRGRDRAVEPVRILGVRSEPDSGAGEARQGLGEQPHRQASRKRVQTVANARGGGEEEGSVSLSSPRARAHQTDVFITA